MSHQHLSKGVILLTLGGVGSICAGSSKLLDSTCVGMSWLTSCMCVGRIVPESLLLRFRKHMARLHSANTPTNTDEKSLFTAAIIL